MTVYVSRLPKLQVAYEDLADLITNNHLALQLAQDLSLVIAKRLQVITEPHTRTELFSIQPVVTQVVQALIEQREQFQDLVRP